MLRTKKYRLSIGHSRIFRFELNRCWMLCQNTIFTVSLLSIAPKRWLHRPLRFRMLRYIKKEKRVNRYYMDSLTYLKNKYSIWFFMYQEIHDLIWKIDLEEYTEIKSIMKPHTSRASREIDDFTNSVCQLQSHTKQFCIQHLLWLQPPKKSWQGLASSTAFSCRSIRFYRFFPGELFNKLSLPLRHVPVTIIPTDPQPQ